MSRLTWKRRICLFTWDSSTMADSWSNRVFLEHYNRCPKSFLLWQETFNSNGEEIPVCIEISNGEEFIEAFRDIIDRDPDAYYVTLKQVLPTIFSFHKKMGEMVLQAIIHESLENAQDEISSLKAYIAKLESGRLTLGSIL